MRKWAKGFTLLLTLVMVLTACSSGSGKTNTPDNEQTNAAAGNNAANNAVNANAANEGANNTKATNADSGNAAPAADTASIPKSEVDPNLTGEVTFWTFLDNKKADAELTKQFNAVYPNIKLKTVFVPLWICITSCRRRSQRAKALQTLHLSSKGNSRGTARAGY